MGAGGGVFVRADAHVQQDKMALTESQKPWNICVTFSLLSKYLSPRLTTQEEPLGRQTKSKANLQRGPELRPRNPGSELGLLPSAGEPGPNLTVDGGRINLKAVSTSDCSTSTLQAWFPRVGRPALCPVWTVSTSSSVEEAGGFVPKGYIIPFDLVLCVSESGIETDVEFGLGSQPLV